MNTNPFNKIIANVPAIFLSPDGVNTLEFGTTTLSLEPPVILKLVNTNYITKQQQLINFVI